MDWRMTDEQRAELLAAVQGNIPVRVSEGVTLVEAYAFALGELRGKVERTLSMLERIPDEGTVDESETEADTTADLF